MDGLPYSLVDSVLGIWLFNVATNKRYLVGLVRKRLVCDCGCRGWCTYSEVMRFLHWAFACMAAKRHPMERHDREGWGAADVVRASRAGTEMKMAHCIIRIKGDWAGFCEWLGLPTWQSNMRPCMCCAASGEDLYLPEGVSVLELPYHVNSDADYAAAAARCEIWVRLTDETRGRVVATLDYDKRPDGNLGRALTTIVPGVPELRVGDRLEPNELLRDVGQLENIAMPEWVLFWRRSMETLCLHRSPLWDETIGITPTRSIALDLLHTLYLGPMMAWCKMVLFLLIDAPIWGVNEATKAEQEKVATRMIKTELLDFYKRWKRDHGHEDVLTALQTLTRKMIGSRATNSLKTKAAETWGLTLFLIQMVEKYRGPIGGAAAPVLEAGRCLERYIRILKSQGTNMTPDAVQEATMTWVHHLNLIAPFDIFLPKHHLMLHVNHRAILQGNPWMYTTFLDESLNKELKKCLRLCHQSTFEDTAFVRVDQVLKRCSKRQWGSRY